MNVAKRLVERARAVDADKLHNLIGDSMELMTEERRGRASEKVKTIGGLVRAPPLDNVLIIGDVHGDLKSLQHILSSSHFPFDDTRSDVFTIVFLGDYIDRGEHSIETLYVALSLKQLHSNQVILLRGNHEGPPDMPVFPHDLPYQYKLRFGAEYESLYEETIDLFQQLPHAALIENRCLMVHGGVPQEVKSIKDLASADETHPKTSFLEEILWSDPQEGLEGTSPSPRGAGLLFGSDISKKVTRLLNINLIIRGHEPCDNGVKVNHEGKMLTIFSRLGAPYYNHTASYLKTDFRLEDFDAYSLSRSATSFSEEDLLTL